uniref:Uncharacterized protein n=1 Tax=Rhizophora mucronata TaxID=61149 RepID=A0A2P2PJZ2_RHIMU
MCCNFRGFQLHLAIQVWHCGCSIWGRHSLVSRIERQQISVGGLETLKWFS